jgi:hypothetical protein
MCGVYVRFHGLCLSAGTRTLLGGGGVGAGYIYLLRNCDKRK